MKKLPVAKLTRVSEDKARSGRLLGPVRFAGTAAQWRAIGWTDEQIHKELVRAGRLYFFVARGDDEPELIPLES